MLRKILRSLCLAIAHPAVLLSAGNVALIVGQAEPIAVLLNVSLTVVIFSARFVELLASRSFGIPFLYLQALISSQPSLLSLIKRSV